MQTMTPPTSTLALLVAVAGAVSADRAEAQPAPVPRAVISADAPPEAMADFFGELESGETSVDVPGATWLQLRFEDYQLGDAGTLTVTPEAGDGQTFTQEQLEQWEGLTARFDGSSLTVSLDPGETAPGEAADASVSLQEVIAGVPGGPGTDEASVAEAAGELSNTLGGELDQYLYDYEEELQNYPMTEEELQQESALGEDAMIESLCGQDDRTASSDARVGRIMPIGCTGWIIDGGRILTAGHCISPSTQLLEFNVPQSSSTGATRPSAVRDQYRIIADSITAGSPVQIGNDWAVFDVQPNTETGLMPLAAQGASFRLSNSDDPGNVRITGYGVDDGAANQTQQTHAGALTDHQVNGPNSARLNYTADTMGGNSGSPVIAEGSDPTTIGIHTNGGCFASGGANAGTSFRNAGLWQAVATAGATDDIVWHHREGQVHYWPIQNGQRQGGINIHTPVGGNWHLAGAGDVDGDGTADIVWQHREGQVHYWPIQNGQRQGGINIHTPVGGDWHLAGIGDVDGDRTADIVWQHRGGQVHYWPIQNGQRQGGINIHSPVGGEWRLAGVGDVDGDGTDDIVWQHRSGQVHYWPMQNGQRQGGINIHTPVGGDWRLAGLGNVD